MNSKESTALIVMDFINEIVHPEGKLGANGYADFIARHETLQKVAKGVEFARQSGALVVYVRVGFSEDYSELIERSILLGKARENNALCLGTWATEWHTCLDVRRGDLQIIKHRISPFYETGLDLQLRSRGITELFLAGVATDLVVESAARDAHDRGYGVTVLEDCCAAASDEEHESSLSTMRKFAQVRPLTDFM